MGAAQHQSPKVGRLRKGMSRFPALSQPGLGNGAVTRGWGALVFGMQGPRTRHGVHPVLGCPSPSRQ